jgi:hypothetical protein
MYYVYVIWARNEEGEEVRYYGHTHDMKEREDAHRNSYNAWVRAGRPDKIRESGSACRSVFILDMEDWRIDVLHELDCDEEETSRVEGNYIRYNKCVNFKMDGRTMAQYYQDNRETILQQTKQRHQNNKERNNERSRQHHYDNRDKHLQQMRQYRNDNRDALLAKQAEKVPCPCGELVSYRNMARHLRSQKHKDAMTASTSSS